GAGNVHALYVLPVLEHGVEVAQLPVDAQGDDRGGALEERGARGPLLDLLGGTVEGDGDLGHVLLLACRGEPADDAGSAVDGTGRHARAGPAPRRRRLRGSARAPSPGG